MKVGFVTIAGKPNSGKSTLINQFVGEKVAIVSWRPQTTRNRITGIVNGDGYQIIFIDTPGLHNSQNRLGEYMMRSVDVALKDVDLILYVVNAEKGFDKFDMQFLDEHLKSKSPIIVAVNKIDKTTRESLFLQLEKLKEFNNIKAVIPVCAKNGDGVNEVLNEVLKYMPEGEPCYPEDIYTDKTMRFMASEIIREKTLKLIDKEIPHGIGVNINKFEFSNDNKLCSIDADIVCEKDTHKPIIIGKGGSMLKKIATEARIDIEEMVDCKVFLEIWVRVKKDWRDSDYLLSELGYSKKDL